MALKKCPFCKNEIKAEYREISLGGKYGSVRKVVFTCDKCGLEATFNNLRSAWNEYDMEKATKKWNKRGAMEQSTTPACRFAPEAGACTSERHR